MNPQVSQVATETSDLSIVRPALTVVAEANPALIAAPGLKTRRPRIGLRLLVPVVVLLLIVAVIAWALTHRGTSEGVGTLAVTQVDGTPLMTVTNGSFDLTQLRSALAKDGHAGLIVPTADGAFEVTTNLIVGKRGKVTVAHTALLLLSDNQSHVRISVNGGQLFLTQDTITSWTPSGAVDTDLSDGRADIVADGPGSRMDFTNSVVSFLGANADDPGVSWRDSALGTIRSTSFTDDYRGAYAYRSGTLTVSNSTFSSNGEDGFYVLYPGAGSSIKSSHFDGNVSNGLEVDQASAPYVADDEASDNGGVGLTVDNGSGARISRALIHDNKQQGLVLTGPTGVEISGSKLWSNATGIAVSGGDAAIEGTDFSGNVVDGVFVTGPTTKLMLTDDRLDHNDRSGLYVSDGAATATGSVFDSNGTGADVAGATAGLVASGDTVVDSIKDGVALTGTAHVTMTGNTITGSGDAAISLAAKADITSMVNTNTIAKGQTVSRVRAS